MPDYSQMPDQQFIFGTLLLTANRMDTMLERELSKFNVTAKQWFMSVIIYSLFDEDPTIKDVARTMGNSHQNVKQVALKLAEKGLLELVKDQNDGRVTRLVMTDKSAAFWAQTDEPGKEFMANLFSGLNDQDIACARKVLMQMWQNLNQMDT